MSTSTTNTDSVAAITYEMAQLFSRAQKPDDYTNIMCKLQEATVGRPLEFSDTERLFYDVLTMLADRYANNTLINFSEEEMIAYFGEPRELSSEELYNCQVLMMVSSYVKFITETTPSR